MTSKKIESPLIRNPVQTGGQRVIANPVLDGSGASQTAGQSQGPVVIVNRFRDSRRPPVVIIANPVLDGNGTSQTTSPPVVIANTFPGAQSVSE